MAVLHASNDDVLKQFKKKIGGKGENKEKKGVGYKYVKLFEYYSVELIMRHC